MSAEHKPVSVTIDGTALQVPEGTLIIRAAEMLGSYIPRFCDHPYLAPLGACRQCLVEVEGQRKPLTACTTPVVEGMIVKTQFSSDMARDAQAGVLELLLINHPLDCPMCDKGGECPLQDQALAYGPGGSRFVDPKRRFVKPVPVSPLVYLDRERCVLCARCTRFASEISGDPFIELFERGALEQVAIFEDQPYESVFSGNVIQICPVGALTSAQFRFKARPFDMESTRSVCNLCASGCNTVVQTRRGEIVRVLAADQPEVNDVWVCDKGRFGYHYVQRPERVTEPLVQKAGEFVAVTWAEAIRVVVEQLDVIKRSGERAAALSGGRLADEDSYALSRFARTALFTNDVDARSRAGTAEEDEVLAGALRSPGATYADIDQAKAIVVAGSDLQQESPIVYLRVRKAMTRRGALAFELGGRATALARTGARAVACPPGTDAGVLLAVAAELASRGVGEWSPEAREAVAGADAKALREQSHASPEAIGSIADALAAAGADAVILAGERLAASRGALAAAWNLALVTGARFGWIPRRAGARGSLWAGVHPGLLPAGRRVGDAEAKAEVEELWGRPVPSSPGRDARAILADASDAALLLLAGVDPAADFGDATLGTRGLERARFLVSLDMFLNASSRRANVVLPVAAVPERDGTLTDWEGRSQPFAAATRTPGVGRPDWEILSLIANEFGVPFPRTLLEMRREMDALALPATRDPEPIALPALPLRRLDEHRPFTLLTYPLLLDGGSLIADTGDLLKTAEPPFIEVGSADAARLGLSAGDRVRVSSACGAVDAPARVTDAMADRCVFVPATHAGLRGLDLLDAGEPVTLVQVEKA